MHGSARFSPRVDWSKTFLIRRTELHGSKSQESHVMKQFVAPTCSGMQATSVVYAMSKTLWGPGDRDLI